MTEITEMHQGNFCVAAWSKEIGSMVRPLPEGGNWNAKLLVAHGLVAGVAIEVEKSGVQPNGSYPHRTEDLPILEKSIKAHGVGLTDWFGGDAPPFGARISNAFGADVVTTGEWDGALKGAHLLEGSKCSSLTAIKVEAGAVEFFENVYKGERSLRARLSDGEAIYNLPVVGAALRKHYRDGGIDAANGALPGKGSMHVRLGCARAWPGQPGKCTIMLNGVNW